ncbi:MAG: phosphonate metabolism protein/1,5-bisphosphokinase (PRPP-forming) PhnN [Hyphomicrobiaceae bacterium]
MTTPASGTLALVVGGSGVGKDTLLRGARAAFAVDPRLVFPRRYITRPPDVTEDHFAVTPDQFSDLAAGGGLALSWSAHGLSYAIPATIDDDLAAGRVVVCNVSRNVVQTARTTYRRTCVIEIQASVAVRAERLAQRDREGGADIAARLEREVPQTYTPDHVVVNEGGVAASVARFVEILRSLAT